MHVASIELCKALYRVSGWKGTDFFYQLAVYDDQSSGYVLVNPVLEEPLSREAYPAYDLGYLMRRLPSSAVILKRGPEPPEQQYSASLYSTFDYKLAAMPEDAACLLAIEVFRQGFIENKASERQSLM